MHPPKNRLVTMIAGSAALLGAATGCGDSSATGAAQITKTTSRTTAEVNPAGDIPDNQAYVRFSPAGAGFSIRIPEGWSRTTGSHVTTFTDKLNTIRIEPVTGDRLTPAKIRRQEPNRLARTVDGYSPGSTTVVRRPAGDVVRITYTATGSPDVVTGRRTTDAVEEYTFVDRGRGLRLTLSGPKGADNVDPWRIVTDSVRWTR